MNQRLTMSVKDAAAALGFSHWGIRKFVRQGRLRAVKIGRRILIELSELERFVAQGRSEGRR